MVKLYNEIYEKEWCKIEMGGSKQFIRTDSTIRKSCFPVEEIRWARNEKGKMTKVLHNLFAGKDGLGFAKTFDQKTGRCVSVTRYKQVRYGRRVKHGIGWVKGYLFSYKETFFRTDITIPSKIKGCKFRKSFLYEKGKLIWVKAVYDNGQLAYHADLSKKGIGKECKVFYPNGRIFCVFYNVSKVLGQEDIYSHTYDKYYENGIIHKSYLEGEVIEWRREDGSYVTKGKIENGQRVGEWLVNNEKKYFIQGVAVSRRIFYKKPEKWKAKEVLNIRNAQLRSALMNRMGYEKLVQECEGKIRHKDGDMELIEINNPKVDSDSVLGSRWRRHNDPIILLLKVRCPTTGTFYVLRVPPLCKECEQARQWTFGRDLRRTGFLIPGTRQEGKFINFTKET